MFKRIIKFFESCPLRGVHAFTIVLLLFLIVHIFIFTGVQFIGHFRVCTGDICPYNRAIALMSKGRIFNSLLEIENVPNLPYHFFPIFWLFLPLYKLFPGPFILQFLETFFLALGGIPIYWLARDKLKSNFAGMVFGICYLLYPALQAADLFGFHPKLMSVTFILFAFYYIEKGRFKSAMIFTFLALLTQESVGVMVAALGIYTIFVIKNKRLGLVVFSMGVIWAFLTMVLLLPPLYDQPSYFQMHGSGSRRWSHLGSTSQEIIINTLTNPVYAVTHNNFDMKLNHFVFLFAPLGFVSFLDPLPMLIILHEAVMNFTSITPDFYSVYHHYQGYYIPFIFISAIGGVGRLLRILKSKIGQKILLYNILMMILFFGILSNQLCASIPLSRFAEHFYGISTFKPDNHYYLLMNTINSIPKNSSVVADHMICGYVGLFDRLYLSRELPSIYKNRHGNLTADYLIYDSRVADEGSALAWKNVDLILDIGDNYTLTNSTDGILLYKRNV